LRAFSARDVIRPFWEVGIFSNLRLFGVVALSFAVQIGIHHVPVMQELFQISPLSLFDCILSVLMGSVPLLILELTKVVKRRLHPSPGSAVETR
jgi:P-type Ca2+ transporter type 2C